MLHLIDLIVSRVFYERMITVRSAILEKQKKSYTFMDKVFSAINNTEGNYNWLLTNYECNLYPDELIPDDTYYK